MNPTPLDQPPPPKPLRLWPGIAAAVLLVLVEYALPALVPGAMLFGVIGGLVCVLAILIWWLFLSRAPWLERLGAIGLLAFSLVVTSRLVHVSVRTGGMGMLFFFLAIPVLALALVIATVLTHRLSTGARRASIAAILLLTCGSFALLRTGGVSGGGGSDLHWRWTPTPEQRLLARGANQPKPRVAVASSPNIAAEWPGFRGPGRDGILPGVRVQTDWSRFPPVELWRRPIGPGWSSFAVRGDLLYTQEQRGEDELVSCYKVSTGEPVWRHLDQVRFWESNAGPGPRATPSLRGNRLYAFGGTGILNALDAANGALVWSRDVAADTNIKVPMWGFASSPLVLDDVVIVAATGKLAAYDLVTGKPRWFGPSHTGSYSSPQLSNLGGVTQVLQLSGAGVTSIAPASGSVLWEYSWPGFTIVQPALLGDGDILSSICGAAGGTCTRRLAVAYNASGWTIQERWTSTGLKPYFNDLVVHDGHAFGFDNSVLACINLADGKRAWKGGHYGNGQLLLLPEQNLLLVLSEQGELALVEAKPDQYKEVARFAAIKGKTWNHPALVGDLLLVRNSEEMAAFRVSLAKL